MKHDPLVRLQVHRRSIERGEAGRDDALTVHCPISREARTVEHCAGCSRFEAIEVDAEGASLLCHVPEAARPARLLSERRLCDALEGTFAAEIACSDVDCLDPELQATEAAKLMEVRGVAAAPVVDDRGVLVGLISAQTRPDPDEEVEDAMSSQPVTLPENASVADAVVLMARSGRQHLPIVTAAGEVVGMLSAIDLVRWLARVGGR